MRTLLLFLAPLAMIWLVGNRPAPGAGWGCCKVSNTVVSSELEQVEGQTSELIQTDRSEDGSPPRPNFQVGTTDVQVSLDVTESGKAIRGLTAGDFTVEDDGQPQKILTLVRDSAPLDVVLLLDVSGSVRKYLRDIATISRSALRRLRASDRVAVMIFSRDARVEQTFTSNPAETASAIEKASREEPPGSGTRIYSAVAQAAHYLGSQNSGRLRRRVILIVTDNSGISYNMHQDRVLQSLYDANVTLEALVIGRHPHPPEPSPGSMINPDFAFDDVFLLADRTGGEAIPTKRPKNSLGNMLGRVRDRYLLVYHVPPAAVAGGFRKIRVELSPAAKRKIPRAVVIARAGYYVSGPAAQTNGAGK